MLSFRKEKLKSHQDAKVYICGKRIIGKLEIIIIIQENIEAQHIVFVIQNLMCPMKSL